MTSISTLKAHNKPKVKPDGYQFQNGEVHFYSGKPMKLKDEPPIHILQEKR